jgi:hypothetical protein
MANNPAPVLPGSNSTDLIWSRLKPLAIGLIAFGVFFVFVIYLLLNYYLSIHTSGHTFLWGLNQSIPFFGIALILVGVVIYWKAEATSFRLRSEELRIVHELVREQPEKIKPAWDLASAKLEQYFNKNLSQINYIFFLSAAVMIMGFVIILCGVMNAVSVPDEPAETAVAASPAKDAAPQTKASADQTDKTAKDATPQKKEGTDKTGKTDSAAKDATAQTKVSADQNGKASSNKPGSSDSIVVIAGVITEFIAATFLFLYKSIMQQAEGYTKTLERINSVGMAMQIMDTISNDSVGLRDKTKAELIHLLMSDKSTPVPPGPNTKEPAKPA